MRRRMLGTAAAMAAAASVALGGLATAAPVTTIHDHSATAAKQAASQARFWVGAAKTSITPRSLTGVYLGGYGIGPAHPAKGVLRPIYARSLAIRDARGHQAVITSLDLQGHFLAYTQGPYGFADMAATLHRQLGIPADAMLFQTTHTHNGPDDLGIWGGVPTSYLRYVTRQTERAVRLAVHREQPAALRWATIALPDFTSTFSRTGDSDDPATDGDKQKFPVDPTLRVLQARSPSGRVISTLVDFACHATVYGPLDKVSPDWPGATATYLESDERGMPARVHAGYPRSIAVVIEGDLGHTWPGGIPRFGNPRLNPPKRTDNNYPADAFGNAIARAAIRALHRGAHRVTGPIGSTQTAIDVANDNPVLLAALANPVQGLQAYRKVTPPYGAGDVITSTVAALRIGPLLFVGAPGEEYPTVNAALAGDVPGAVTFPVSLADDQLGYLGSPQDYVEAQECSLTDEGFFTISPLFGNQVLQAQRADATRLGFRVNGANGLVHSSGLSADATCLSSQLP